MAIDESVAARFTAEVSSTMSPTAVSAPSPKQVISRAKELGVKMVDLRFTDLPGTWQHFSAPIRVLDQSLFAEGIGFDGSSIRGFQEINESDMLLVPDPATAILDPFTADVTLSLVCNVTQPGAERYPYTRDPRNIARKAEEYLGKSGIADRAYFGPEAEFFVFDDVKYRSNQKSRPERPSLRPPHPSHR